METASCLSIIAPILENRAPCPRDANLSGRFYLPFHHCSGMGQGIQVSHLRAGCRLCYRRTDGGFHKGTTLKVIFDPVNIRVFLCTNRNPQIRYLDFSALDFSCGSTVMVLDIHTGDAGDLADDLLKYSHQMTFEHTKIMTENTWQVDVSPYLLMRS